MQKKLLATITLVLLNGMAQGQSLQIYGELDASISYSKNATSAGDAYKFGSSYLTTSVWGLQGFEDLGGGAKSFYKLESDVNLGTGAGHSSDTFFRRGAYVGLSNDLWGELSLGRRIAPGASLLSESQALKVNTQTTNVAAGMGASADLFTINAITYTTPKFSNLLFTAQYSPGGVAGSFDSGSKISGSIKYTLNNFLIGASTEQVYDLINNRSRTWSVISGKYTVNKLTVSLAYLDFNINPNAQANSPSNTNPLYYVGIGSARSSQSYQTGIAYNYTPQTIFALSHTYNTLGNKVSNFVIKHDLSKKVSLYLQGVHADNTHNNQVLFASNWSTVSGVYNTRQSNLGFGMIQKF